MAADNKAANDKTPAAGVDTWRGELPFTALVGADGGLVTVIGAVDDPLIASFLEKSGK